MTDTYTMRRTPRGDPQALTVIPLGFDERVLHITTDKASPGLSCVAAVFRVTADGLEHTFGVGRPGTGDFRRTLASAGSRATERALQAMHAGCIADTTPIVAAAMAHYGKAPAVDPVGATAAELPCARLSRFLRTHERLAESALRAVLAGDDQALAGQADQHRYVLSEIKRMRANSAGATP